MIAHRTAALLCVALGAAIAFTSSASASAQRIPAASAAPRLPVNLAALLQAARAARAAPPSAAFPRGPQRSFARSPHARRTPSARTLRHQIEHTKDALRRARNRRRYLAKKAHRARKLAKLRAELQRVNRGGAGGGSGGRAVRRRVPPRGAVVRQLPNGGVAWRVPAPRTPLPAS